MAFTLLVYAMFVFFLLFGVRIGKIDEEGVCFRRFNSLRGLFALEIVIGHVIRYEATLLYPLGKFMIVSVAFFFFVSGWGLCRSYHQKADYLHHFLPRKCGYLLVLSLFAFAVRIVVLLAAGRYVADKNIILQYLESTNWYIWELIFFYCLFFLIYRFLSKYRCTVIALVTFVMMTVAFFVGMIQGYYSSAMAFPAGVIFYEYYPAIVDFLRKIQGKILICIMAAFGLSSLLLGTDSLIGMVYLRNVMCLAVLCIMVRFLTYFHTDNLFLRFLGKYSTEIYLYQFVFLEVTAVLPDWRIRILLVCALTLLTAIVIHPVQGWIRKKLFSGKLACK